MSNNKYSLHFDRLRSFVRARWSAFAHPVRQRWLAFTGPVRKQLHPAYKVWTRYAAPVQGAWAAGAFQYPILFSILRWMGRGFVWGLGLLAVLIFCVGLGFFGRLPDSRELRNIETANATEVYAADSVLIGKFYIENRTAITLDKISPHVINALVATEDRRFFEHSGIDFFSLFRVGVGVLLRKDSGGGSTLSQQLAKNLYPREYYGVPYVSLLINKIRENYISIRLERIYTKEELLTLYLNTVPFGGDIFGISVASRHYFGKKAKDLAPDEAATLIGMLKATTYYNPVRNPENARRRRNIVLRMMVNNGHLDQPTYESLIQKKVNAHRYTQYGNNEGTGTYLREFLRTEVMPRILKKYTKEDGTPYNLYTDGLRIYTTIDSKMQRFAEEAVIEHMSELQDQFDKHWKNYKNDKPWGDDKWILDQIKKSDRWHEYAQAGLSEEAALQQFEEPVAMTVFSWKGTGAEIDTVMSPLDSVRYYFCLLNCGFLAMEHSTGQVKAWVGGTNFKYFKFDHVRSKRQVGSTFKPIVYAAALQKGVSPCSFYPNELYKIDDWEPKNADDTYGGFYSVKGALAGSINVVAAQLIEESGIGHTIDLARSMGVSSTIPREYGISLGAVEVSLYDMVKVYGTMANGGVRPDPVVVTKVTTRTGEVVYERDPAALKPNAPAMTSEEARVMTRMLQNVIESGTGSRLRRGYGLLGDFAGKTGTTQNQADGWFICYNPDLVTGAWVGAETPVVRFRSLYLGQGASMALPIVGKFWYKLSADKQYYQITRKRFRELTEEQAAMFDCPYFVDVPIDSLLLMAGDTVLSDSLKSSDFDRLKNLFATYFKDGIGGNKNKEEETEGGEEQPKEKKPLDFFNRLLGKKKSEDAPEPEKQQ